MIFFFCFNDEMCLNLTFPFCILQHITENSTNNVPFVFGFFSNSFIWISKGKCLLFLMCLPELNDYC